MGKECLWNNGRHCDIWADYQVALYSLEEAEELAHENWVEIQTLYDRLHQLETYISSQGLPLPEESE